MPLYGTSREKLDFLYSNLICGHHRAVSCGQWPYNYGLVAMALGFLSLVLLY